MGDAWKNVPLSDEIISGKEVLEYAIAEGYHTEQPIRGTKYSAGLDVFIPYLTPEFVEDFQSKNPGISIAGGFFVIPPHARIILPTGLKFNIPEGTYLEVANRGSVAAKMGLIRGAFVIDSDYVGNVFINLINTSDKDVIIRPAEKIAQLIHKEYIHSTLKLISEEEIKKTIRGDGALGSTGK